jgi:hypothetical protein
MQQKRGVSIGLDLGDDHRYYMVFLIFSRFVRMSFSMMTSVGLPTME